MFVEDKHRAMAFRTVLHVSGRTTDSVMDTGDDVSHIVSIYESCALHHVIFVWLADENCFVAPRESKHSV